MENLSDFSNQNEILTLPMLILPGFSAFPGATAMIELSQPNEEAVIAAQNESSLVFLTTVDMSVKDNIVRKRAGAVGTVARVEKLYDSKRDGNMRNARMQCLYRAELLSINSNDKNTHGFVYADVRHIEETCDVTENEAVAYKMVILKLVSESGGPNAKFGRNFLEVCIAETNLGKLCDFVAGNVRLAADFAHRVLECADVRRRAEVLIEALGNTNEIDNLEAEINSKLQTRIDKQQREYQLREKMAVIAEELGGGDNMAADAQKYRQKAEELNMPEQCAEKLFIECDRLAKMAPLSADAAVMRGHIEACLALPWNIKTKDKTNISAARKQLDRDHYGLEKVKQRIIEQMCVYTLTGNAGAQILCLAGPPGVGKTSIARSVATAMGRKFARISLGGVSDEAEIRGHRRTYIGSMPGRIISAVTEAGSSNPVILLDEVDKMGMDYKGDPSQALLEVLDPEQNSTFTDHFIDMPFDLSSVLFITTANDIGEISAPLRDRMEIIELPGYTSEEKCKIAKQYLIKKQLKKHGITADDLRVSEKALYAIMDGYTREAGVRELERVIAKLCRKAAVQKVEQNDGTAKITPTNLEQYLGVAKYRTDKLVKRSQKGVCNGLAWTAAGGELLKLEAAAVTGTGKVQLTGSLGDVMKESALTAISYIRCNAAEFGIDEDFYDKKDIHIHAPEGAVPKDGPSAGVTITTAAVSALTGIPVRGDIAMTGEVTLLGNVLAIGGLKEKSMAAFKNGISTVVIPKENEPDISEISPAVKEKITFVPVEHVSEVLRLALDFSAANGSDFKTVAANALIKNSGAEVHNEV